MQKGEVHADVVVAGAGIAGLTAAVFLARAGLEVVCIDPDPMPASRVGESLDWSASPLFHRIELPIDQLVESGVATYKRELRGRTSDGQDLIGRPFGWLQRWPFRFEGDTLHLDRGAFDRALSERARGAGVNFVRDGIAEVATQDGAIVDCTTRSGQRYAGDWFVDATGRARVLARALGVRAVRLSEQRVSLWSYCRGSVDFEGTRLHLDSRPDGLGWAWEIPVGDDRLSVGVVMTADDFRGCRRSGMSPAEVFHTARQRFPDCRRFNSERWDDVKVRGHQGNLSEKTYGPNWLLVGEAACFVDPITSIGVTSAMRHGSEAAEIIVETLGHPETADAALDRYERRVTGMARLFNDGVERLLYDNAVRSAFGMRWAARAYVPMGYVNTAMYGKVRAGSRLGTALLGGMFGLWGFWIRAWVGVAGLVNRRRP